jgi:hypothetical protein
MLPVWRPTDRLAGFTEIETELDAEETMIQDALGVADQLRAPPAPEFEIEIVCGEGTAPPAV